MRGPLRKMISFFLVESRLGPRRKQIDWTLVLFWAGIAIALWILLAVR
jgi:hypothetical protein